MAGIYVHVPFCQSRCAYCDFFSTTRVAERDAYVSALCREIEARREEPTSEGVASEAVVRTIYFGGGTPSTLSQEQLNTILDCIYTNYRVASDAEVTLEMNPDDWPLSRSTFGRFDTSKRSALPLCSAKNSPRGGEDSITSEGKNENIGLAALPPTGGAGRGAVNRVSLGIQTFDDSLLRLIRRRHDAQGAIEAVRNLQDAGIKNISIDLIYGLPGQTLEQWQHDLDIAFSLGIQHLSAYALSYEPGTALSRWRDEGLVSEAADELSVAMYEMLCRRAREAGFEHYEISNFALPGRRSRHNSSYWSGSPYLGFGPGAHSFDGDRTRLSNSSDLDLYFRLWNSLDSPPVDSPPVDSPPALPVREGAVTFEDGDTLLSKHSAPSLTGRAGGESWRAGGESTGGESTGRGAGVEVLTDAELYDEAVMCGLRTSLGISLDEISQRFSQERLDYLMHMAAPHIKASRLVLADGRLRLSEQALMISDDIMSDLMAPPFTRDDDGLTGCRWREG